MYGASPEPSSFVHIICLQAMAPLQIDYWSQHHFTAAITLNMDIGLIYNILITIATVYAFHYVLMYMIQSKDEPRALVTSLPFIFSRLGLSQDQSGFYIRL